ncbi:hypothetical protein LSAT2_022269 [Lamellibrachia satsuma]|nr:hypothetical protein LSAT2_022269 [Lamellibrachia satsuma]
MHTRAPVTAPATADNDTTHWVDHTCYTTRLRKVRAKQVGRQVVRNFSRPGCDSRGLHASPPDPAANCHHTSPGWETVGRSRAGTEPTLTGLLRNIREQSWPEITRRRLSRHRRQTS